MHVPQNSIHEWTTLEDIVSCHICPFHFGARKSEFLIVIPTLSPRSLIAATSKYCDNTRLHRTEDRRFRAEGV